MAFRLGQVLVEPTLNRVSTDAAQQIVEPRVMEVLVCLASHGDGLVTREELTRSVWGDVNVGYHALARAISEARRALKAVAPDLEFIETIPRRGYRFKIPPEPVAVKASAVARSSDLTSVPKRLAAAAIPFGLTMHAFGLHGTPLHLLGLAAITAVVLRPYWSSPKVPVTGARAAPA